MPTKSTRRLVTGKRTDQVCYSLLEVQKKHNMTVMSNSQLIIVFLILAHGQMLNVMGVFLSLISRFSGMKNSQHNYNWDVPQRARRPGMTAGVGLQLYSLRQKWQWQFNLCLTFSFVFIAALFSDETVECRSYRANPRIIYVVLLKRALTLYSLRPFPLSRASHNTTHSFNSVTV